ncbi:MAG TPA: ABC transporter permease [Candidatus Sulfomarinibacteraceae bacterium]|nr:ABC transporter permease [Candidatus Sulfomarinibacteraceae bacterium]
MRTYLIKRLFMTLVVLVVVTIFLTLLVYIVPGDPAISVLGPRANPDLIARVRAAMYLDRTLPEQIGLALWNLARLDLGQDIFTGRPIRQFVGAALPHTLILAWTSLSLAVLIGIPLGVYSSTHPDSWLDRFTAIFSISFITVPSYVAGLFLLLIFAVRLQLMPAIGLGERGDVLDYIRHLILPATALAIPWIGYLARLVRASLLEVLNQTYIRAEMAAGLPMRKIYYKYALKNAIIPTVAVLGLGVGNLMAGAVFVELIFARPGMGTLIYNAIQARNYPLVRAGVLTVAFLFVAANLLADILYTYLDPRIQYDKGRA